MIKVTIIIISYFQNFNYLLSTLCYHYQFRAVGQKIILCKSTTSRKKLRQTKVAASKRLWIFLWQMQECKIMQSKGNPFGRYDISSFQFTLTTREVNGWRNSFFALWLVTFFTFTRLSSIWSDLYEYFYLYRFSVFKNKIIGQINTHF